MSVTYTVTDLFVKFINVCMGYNVLCHLNLLTFRE